MNKCLLAVLILSVAGFAWADDSQAVSFARQAGIVAGAAQACGQSTAMMASRTSEVIAVLATDPSDASAATGAYKRAADDSSASYVLSQRLTCSKVVSDFNNLPLLKADYQQTVIDPLMKDRPAAATPATPVAPVAASTTTPAVPAANSTSLVAAAQATVPAQQVVNANPAAGPSPVGSAPSGSPATAANPNLTNEQARLQLAQKLADMAQSLIANQPAAQAQLQQQFTTDPYQNRVGYQTNNPQTNQYLNGVGANNPSITNSLGVQPYPAGQTSGTTTADSGVQPYPYTP